MNEVKETTSTGGEEISPRCQRWMLPKKYMLAIMCNLAFFLRGMVVANIFMIIFNHLAWLKGDEDITHLPSISNFTTEEMTNVAYTYYWVIAIGQTPSAILAFMFSPQKILVISIALSFLLQMITPWTLTKSITGVVINVLLQGLCVCPLDCACIGIWKKWASTNDRTCLVMISFSGRYAHFLIAFWFSTYLSQSVSPSFIYYFTGTAGAVWCILWYSLTSGAAATNYSRPQCIEESIKTIPLKSILKSLPVLCICLIFISPALSYRSLMNFIFLHSVGNENLPVWILNINCILIVPITGYLLDWLVNSKKCKTATVRKILCSGGLALHVLFVIISIIPDEIISALCFYMAFIAMDLTATGIVPNILDVSSRFCVPIMGLAMTSVSVSGILSDYMHPMIFSESDKHWILSLIPMGIFALISALLYAVKGSAEEQSWSTASSPANKESSETGKIFKENETNI